MKNQTWDATLRQAIQERIGAGESIRSIARRAGIEHTTLIRYLSTPGRTLELGTAEGLARLCGYDLRQVKRRKAE